MIDLLTTIFCSVDDYIKYSKRQPLITPKGMRKGRERRLFSSEVATIYIFYHLSNFKNFKSYYLDFKDKYRAEFPTMVSYNRFIELIPEALELLVEFLASKVSTAKPGEANFIDSTKIQVCKNKRIQNNKVFKGLATIGKSSMGWFYGFKLHLVVNERGEILSFWITKGNVSDVVAAGKLFGHFKMIEKLFGDKGYISKKLFLKLYQLGIKLITNIRSKRISPLEISIKGALSIEIWEVEIIEIWGIGKRDKMEIYKAVNKRIEGRK